ncbi:formate dehydrogenase subunit gamma [Stenoxybacter acetivorans]|uniref:formate dehydrogenase subunit gamma n=1 Tax=Stenoxybacter acetivorans TaxID=422441 RepID=UPI0005685606|nr:formate dehydrogenase subunit gamma [Stenoxybacter acetivorans]
MKQQPLLQRYKRAERINHWVVAGCFVLLAISGLGFFYSSFFWLTNIFGSPQLARIFHPFIGIVMFIGFFILFLRYWRHNFLDKEDVRWLKSVKTILKGHEVGDIGKYNGGQKAMFWLMSACVALLFISGIIIWRPYFAPLFPIPLIRIALLVHCCAAVVLISGIIIHVYAAIWVKGTIPSMVEGVVSQEWAKKHHPRWYREMMEKHRRQEQGEKETS